MKWGYLYLRSEKKREWTNIERLIAKVKYWGWLLQDVKVSDGMIVDSIRELSSPMVRALLVDEQNVMLSSLSFDKIVQNIGDLGKTFETYLMGYIDKATKLKESSRT